MGDETNFIGIKRISLRDKKNGNLFHTKRLSLTGHKKMVIYFYYYYQKVVPNGTKNFHWFIFFKGRNPDIFKSERYSVP